MTSRRSTGYRLLLAVAVIATMGMLTGATFLGGRLVDKFCLDASSDYIAALLVTREVAPGDDVSIDLFTGGTLRTVRARIGHGPEDIWTADRRGGENGLVLTLPPEMQLGPVTITLEAEVGVRIETGRTLNTHYYRNASRSDRVEITLPVRSADERTWRRWLFRALALASWLAACGASYALGRWAFRGVMARWRRKSKSVPEETVMLLCFVVAVAVAALGQLVFVGLILRTTALASWPPILGIQFGWTCAIAIGLWRGLVARAKAPPVHLWDPVRLRAVIGTGREVGYREVASTLPPMLSRDATRCDSARIIETLREMGCDVTLKRGVLEVTVDSEPVMLLRGKCAEPWLPEDLVVSIRAGIEGTPLVLQLTKLFGPLEVKPPDGRPVILEQRA